MNIYYKPLIMLDDKETQVFDDFIDMSNINLKFVEGEGAKSDLGPVTSESIIHVAKEWDDLIQAARSFRKDFTY
jgi:hypothetical protein